MASDHRRAQETSGQSKEFSLALTKQELWEVGLKCQAEEFGSLPSRWEGRRPVGPREEAAALANNEVLTRSGLSRDKEKRVDSEGFGCNCKMGRGG